MIEKTKQLVESKYTLENGYDANAKVRAWAHLPALQGSQASYHSSPWVEKRHRSCVYSGRWSTVTLTL